MKTIAITMGDPAGIGPEIIAGAWEQLRAIPGYRCVVYGHPEVMRRAAELRTSNPAIANARINCVTCCGDDVLEVPPGAIDPRAGRAAYSAILQAIGDAQRGTVDAIVTAPIHKAALHRAGYHYPGHTEIFAERCGVENYAMMLYLGAGDNLASQHGLAVVHVTLHTAMKTIFEQITTESVLAKIHLADGFMRRIMGNSRRQTADRSRVGGEAVSAVSGAVAEGNSSAAVCRLPSAVSSAVLPRIGVCSLNPHAGEEGLFGDEEIQIIRPAIEQAIAEGLQACGPQPADTIMLDARDGKYDAIVAMFHDQGHIALKLLGMYRAVNITLGLPIIRTSVAHGTAFDKAWQGTADPGSLLEAVRVAVKLCG